MISIKWPGGRAGIFYLLLPLLVAATIWLTVWQAKITTDISTFFISGSTPETELLANRMQSGELAHRLMLSIGFGNVDPDMTADFTARLIDRLGALPQVSRAWNDASATADAEELLRFYMPHRAQLFSLYPEHDIPLLLSEPSLSQRAEQLHSVLTGAEADWLKPLIKEDPLLLISDWAKKLENNRSASKVRTQYAGVFVDLHTSSLNIDANRQLTQDITSAFDQLNTEYQQTFTLEMTGVPVFARVIQEQITADVKRVSTLSTLLILLAFLWLFRSLHSLWWTSLLLLASLTSAVLVTIAIFGEVHALTLAIGATLIGVCIDYPIHALVHSAAIRNHTQAVRLIWPSLLLGGLTTVVGYMALSLSGYPGLQQTSVFAASGIFIALLLTRYVLPALIGNTAIPAPRLNIQNPAMRLPRGITWSVWLVAGLAAVFAIPNLHWMQDLNRLSPGINELKERDQLIRSRMTSIEPGRFILIRGADAESALQTHEKLLPTLERLKQDGSLSAYYPLYPWIASAQLQKENEQAFRLRLDANTRHLWREALSRQGLNADRIPKLSIPDIKPLTLAELQDSPAAHLLSGRFASEPKQTILTVWLGKHSARALKESLKNIPDAQYISHRDMINDLASAYRERALISLIFGLFLIVLLLSIRYKSPTKAALVLAPATASTLIVLGGWGLVGAEIGILHLIGLLLAVAVCVDYGIFFLENRAGRLEQTYRAIAISALTSTAAFGSLGIADTPALQALAGTVAPGILLGFLFCPLLIRTKQGDGATP